MSRIFPVVFTIIFVTLFGLIIYAVVTYGRQWIKNNNSPLLTVDAMVVTKRLSVGGNSVMYNDEGGTSQQTTYTTYFVTYEVESGDRMEFKVSGDEYGMLAEGDFGRLSFKGTRYKGFMRIIT